MKVHILIVRIVEGKADIPRWIGGRACVILRESFPLGNATRNWIDPGSSRAIGSDAMVLEIIAPNAIDTESVIASLNKAVKEALPQLKSMQWETILFSSIYCMNQDQ